MSPTFARLGPVVTLFTVGILLFPVSGTDDKYITYWSAHALANLGEMVNYNGERVEQSSSLTHVLLLAALAKLVPLSMSGIGWVVSVAFGLATVLMTHRLAGRIGPALARPAAWIAGSALSLVYWSFGGLESTLAACLGTGLLLVGIDAAQHGFSARRVAGAAVLTLLFVAVRPESVFLASATWLGLAASPLVQRFTPIRLDGSIDLQTARRSAALAVLAWVCFAALALFRSAYFGDVFPQPVRAKVGQPTPDAIYQGLRYVVFEPLERWDPLWLVAAGGILVVSIGAMRGVALRVPLIATVLLGLAQVGFVVSAGGDWMGGGRFLVPLVPVAAVFAARLLTSARGPLSRIWLPALVLWQIVVCADFARRTSPSGPLWAEGPPLPPEYVLPVDWFDMKNRTHVHFMPATAELLKLLGSVTESARPPVTILSGQMGFVPYLIGKAFYGRVRFVDIGGLTTRHLTELLETQSFPKSSTGVQFWYTDLFSRMDAGAGPGWIPPDVIFDYELAGGPDAERQQRAQARGYAILFRQDGFPDNGSRIFGGGLRTRRVFVAVRGDLARGATVEYRFGPAPQR